MRKLLLAVAGISALALTSQASAADLAARPYTKAPAMIAAVYDWSGFYIGVNGGGGSSHKCWDLISGFLGAPVVVTSEGCHNATGAVAGGQFGYRWQSGAWVFGVEAQGDWANLSGSNSPSLLLGPFVGGNRTKIDALGVFTGQVGYAWNNVLLYVKGGAMAASDKYEGYFVVNNFVFDRTSETRWGGAVGAGLDFGITPNIVLGVDYIHGFMGSRNVSFTNTVGQNSRGDRISQDVDMVTARLSYKFGGPVIAKY